MTIDSKLKSDVMIKVFSVDGKILFQNAVNFNLGKNKFELSKFGLNQNGLFVIKIETNLSKETFKISINK